MSDYVTIKHSLPPFRASLKDGYAAIASDGVGIRDVLGNSVAGSNAVSYTHLDVYKRQRFTWK